MIAPNPVAQHDMSDDAARSGVTGHNVRYVLAAGLTGVIAAFAMVAIYFGYDTLQSRMSEALSRNPSEWIRELAPYAAITAIGAIAVGLLLGVWTLIAGRDNDMTQSGMRARVVVQFVTVVIIMTTLYLSSSP
jgi:uncharacterized membrane protein YkgB